MEKLFFNKGLIRDLLLWERLGVRIWQLLLEKMSSSQQLQVVFSKKKSPIFFATKVSPPNNTWVSE